MFGNLGIQEIIVIALVLLVLFGSKRLPEITRDLAESAKEFKKGIKDDPDPAAKPKIPSQTPAPTPTNQPAATNQPSKPDDAPKEVN